MKSSWMSMKELASPDEEFKSDELMREHERIHTEEKQFKCTLCEDD